MKALKFTLDTNCLIDLEEGRAAAQHVAKLLRAHRAGEADVAVATVTASERQRGGGFLGSYAEFEERLDRLGMSDVTQIQPIAHWDVSFYGHGYWANEQMAEKEQQIHAILHPDVPMSYAEYCELEGIDVEARPRDAKWRNRLCDTQIVWSHIHHGRDVLVTRDENFFKESKLPRLVEMGVGQICRPGPAAERLQESR